MRNELYHHGIIGMKWGVRKDRSTSSGSRRKKSSPSHEDYQRAHSRKSVKQMSDSELRTRINRLQMEQQYSNLSPRNVSKGKNYFNKIVKAGTTVATITTTGLTIYNNIDKIKKIING